MATGTNEKCGQLSPTATTHRLAALVPFHEPHVRRRHVRGEGCSHRFCGREQLELLENFQLRAVDRDGDVALSGNLEQDLLFADGVGCNEHKGLDVGREDRLDLVGDEVDTTLLVLIEQGAGTKYGGGRLSGRAAESPDIAAASTTAEMVAKSGMEKGRSLPIAGIVVQCSIRRYASPHTTSKH